MSNKRHELFNSSPPSILVPHPHFPTFNTFEHLLEWRGPYTIELPHLRIILHGIDYLESPAETIKPEPRLLNFQQDTYRFWYQIDGSGILQNVTRKTFGTARPGLLGVMDRGERHTYMHQRGNFSCLQILFSLFPSAQSKCYWNSEIEGKSIIDEAERLPVEQTIFTLLQPPAAKSAFNDIPRCSGMLQLLSLLFDKKLICIEESRFPRNKKKSLVGKAKSYIDTHYQTLHHQDALEKECHVDINYLNILFKKETGNTLYHYLSSVRMEHAKYLLETTPHSVVTIATSTGYPNANSFSRAFKRIEHCTPLEYRVRNKHVNK